jgi:hypothetical protein
MEDEALLNYVTNLKKHGPGYTAKGRTGGLGFESKKNKRGEESNESYSKIPDVMIKYNTRFIKFQQGIVSSDQSLKYASGGLLSGKTEAENEEDEEKQDWTKANSSVQKKVQLPALLFVINSI